MDLNAITEEVRAAITANPERVYEREINGDKFAFLNYGKRTKVNRSGDIYGKHLFYDNLFAAVRAAYTWSASGAAMRPNWDRIDQMLKGTNGVVTIMGNVDGKTYYIGLNDIVNGHQRYDLYDNMMCEPKLKCVCREFIEIILGV